MRYSEFSKNQDVTEGLSHDDMYYDGTDDPDGPRTRQDYRVTDKIDFEGMPASLIYRIRADAMRIPPGIKGLAATKKFYNKYKKYLKAHHKTERVQ